MKTSICLAMIVRNEAATLPRLLRSLDEHLDEWLIVDTGSDDDTREIITSSLAHLPGALLQSAWRNFGHNRSELMTLCHEHSTATHLLLADADMEMIVEGDLRAALAAEPAEMLRIRQQSGVYEFRMPYLVRRGPRWYYVGATHEYLTSNDPFTSVPFDALRISHHLDGGSKADKYERDLRLLLDDLAERPGDHRNTFYLGQTLRFLGRDEEAVTAYEERAGLGGSEEEVYYSLLQAGDALDRLGRTAEAMFAWQRAVAARPSRPESYHRPQPRLPHLRATPQSWYPARTHCSNP
jgi:glycosyltransferase involved in cell wall biosynthesis